MDPDLVRELGVQIGSGSRQAKYTKKLKVPML